MNFGKVVPLPPPRHPSHPSPPSPPNPPPHFLEIGVGSLGGGGECVGTLSFVCASPSHTSFSDTLCSIILFGPPSRTAKFQFEIKFNFSFLNSD